MDSRIDTDINPYFSFFAAVSYGIVSMTMVFINKAVLMQYAHSMTLLTPQQLATTLLIHVGRVMRYTKAQGLIIERNCKKTYPSIIILQCKCGICLSKPERSKYSHVHCHKKTYTACSIGSWNFFWEKETYNTDPWFCFTGRSASTCTECDWIGNQHSRWHVVFICQISAEEEQAAKSNTRCSGPSQMKSIMQCL